MDTNHSQQSNKSSGKKSKSKYIHSNLETTGERAKEVVGQSSGSSFSSNQKAQSSNMPCPTTNKKTLLSKTNQTIIKIFGEDAINLKKSEETIKSFGGFSTASKCNTKGNQNNLIYSNDSTPNEYNNQLHQKSNTQNPIHYSQDLITEEMSFKSEMTEIPELEVDYNTTKDPTFLSEDFNLSQSSLFKSQTPNKKDQQFFTNNVLGLINEEGANDNNKTGSIFDPLPETNKNGNNIKFYQNSQTEKAKKRIVGKDTDDLGTDYKKSKLKELIVDQINFNETDEMDKNDNNIDESKDTPLHILETLLEMMDAEALKTAPTINDDIINSVELAGKKETNSKILEYLFETSDRFSEPCTSQELYCMGVTSILEIDKVEDAEQFRFDNKDQGRHWGLLEASQALDDITLIGVEKEIWIKNHYNHIIWNLFNLIKYYPDDFKDFWSPNTVIKLLKLRYYNEHTLKMKSCLKSICEHINLPQNYFIAYVSKIVNDSRSDNTYFYISDGWYSIQCELDQPLKDAVINKNIILGQKLEISGAKLNSEEFVPILNKSNVYLRLDSNGVRFSDWNKTLGFQPFNFFTKKVKDIRNDGGIIPCFFGKVIRKLPLKLMSRSAIGGKAIIRSYEEEVAWRNSEEGMNSGEMDNITPFCSLRVVDKDCTEAFVTIWNIGLDKYKEIKEGGSYYFFNFIPKKQDNGFKSNNKIPIQLNSTSSTKWAKLSEEHESELKGPLIGKPISHIKDLKSLEKGISVDLCLLYLGEHFNGYTFIDKSGHFLVMKAAPFMSNSMKNIKPRQIIILEGALVGGYHNDFDIQEAEFHLYTHMCIKDFNEFQNTQVDKLQSYLFNNHYLINNALYNKKRIIEKGKKLYSIEEAEVVIGKITGWNWNNDGSVIAQLKNKNEIVYDIYLDSTHWYKLLALNLRGRSLTKLVMDLNDAQFINPEIISKFDIKEYLKARKLPNRLDSYSLIMGLIPSGTTFSTFAPESMRKKPTFIKTYRHELYNLKSYFKKRIFLDEFKLYLSPMDLEIASQFGQELQDDLWNVSYVTLPKSEPLTLSYRN